MNADQLYNMDETSMYVDMLNSFTIDFVGNIDASHCGPTKAHFTAVQGVKKVPDPKQNYIELMTEG